MIGETPYGVHRGGQIDLKALFHSRYEDAHIKSISIPAGYGVVPAGSVIGIITESTNRKGMYVPYVPADAGLSAGLTTAIGMAYLTTDGAESASVYVTMADSYKFAVGDHLAATDADTYGASNIDLGAITAIDRTTYAHIAVITVTNNVTTAITVANGGAVFIQSATDAPFIAAAGILTSAADTGVGENAKGATGAMVFGNAVLYRGALYNYDSEVQTDLSTTLDGNLVYFK